MGILACERGEPHEMERIFGEIQRYFNPPPTIERLMQAIRAGGCPPGKTVQSAPLKHTRVSIAAGYNSNANTGPKSDQFFFTGQDIEVKLDESFTPQSDTFYLLELDNQQTLTTPNTAIGFSTRFRQYSRQHQYNEAIVAAWLRNNSTIGDKDSITTFSYAYSNLGGSSYANHFQVASSIGKRELRFENSLQKALFSGRSEYNALIAQTGLAFQSKTDQIFWAARAGLRLDFAENDRPGGDRQGVWAQAMANFPVSGNSILRLQAGFEQMDSKDIYAPGIFDMQRRHRIKNFEASLLVPHQQNSFWRLQLSKRTERDDVPTLNFDQTIISIEFNQLWH